MKAIKVLNKVMCVFGYIFVFFLIVQIIFLTFLFSTVDKVVWNKNDSGEWNLDSMVDTDKDFADAVRSFYAALQSKDWEQTYEFRTSDFKHDVKRDYYLKTMTQDGSSWSLDSCKILSISRYNNDAVRLIMKFNENGIESYNVVWWKKENGVWRCQEAGPHRLSLLTSTRYPVGFKNSSDKGFQRDSVMENPEEIEIKNGK